MDIRFYEDPAAGDLHFHRHDVSEDEVEGVLARSLEDRPGRDGARVALEKHAQGTIFASSTCQTPCRAVFRNHRLRDWTEGTQGPDAATEEETMSTPEYPRGWDEKRVQDVLAHDESRSDDEAVAEDEAAWESTTHTSMRRGGSSTTIRWDPPSRCT